MSFSLGPWLARASLKKPSAGPAQARADREGCWRNPRTLGRFTGTAQMSVTDAEAKSPYRNGFITDFNITEHNVAAIAASGRARWKIENENNHTLQNQGPSPRT